MSAEHKVFIDSNILVYAYDVDAGEKHEIASDLLMRLWNSREGTLSIQVLQEFYVIVTRKLVTPLDPAVARRVITTYQAWPVQMVGVDDVLTASEIAELHQLSFWDGLIVATARQAGAERILSEDFQPGRIIAGVRIENPFVA